MFNFMKKAAEKDDKEKRKREKKERKDVKKRDRSSMSAEELLRLDEVSAVSLGKFPFAGKSTPSLPSFVSRESRRNRDEPFFRSIAYTHSANHLVFISSAQCTHIWLSPRPMTR
jgi:hypothetical protein